MQGKELYEFNDFRLDVSERVFSRGGEAIKLSEKTFDTLIALVRRANRLATKDELMAEIWPDSFVEENNLDKNVSLLRKVLEQHGGKRDFIETVRGHGYRFIADVTTGPGEAKDPASEEAGDNLGSPATTSWRLSPLPVAAVVVMLAAVALVTAYYFFNLRSDAMPPSPKVSRIAVLPFKPIVAESRNEALELGMSDALIDKLNGAEGIAVTPLSSVRRFSSLDQDAAAAGRELNVDAVLDGGVQTSGDRLRISARLLQVSDGRQLWAQQFDEKFTDIFAVQDSISQRVADALKARLGAAKRYTENVEAYALYLKARYLSQRASLKEIRTAIGYLEQALQLDPDYAPAYVVLADAYRATVLIGDEDPAVAMPQAKTAALRAVSIDAGYAEGHAVLGWTIFWYDRDWDKAESELKRALEIDPESSDARQYYAHLLSNTGRHDEAVAEIDKALTLEPLSLRANAFRGIFLFNAGRLDEAIAQLRKTLELQSDFYLARMFLARALNARGDAAEALSVIRGTRVEARTAEHRSLEAVTLARLDRKAESERILNELLDESGTKYVSNYSIASIMAALGRNDEALDRLEKAHSNHDLLMVFLAVDPRWDTLRSDPRFAELVRRLKLP